MELFDQYRGVVEEFLEETVDLTQIDNHALDLLTDPRKREVFRYLTGPPVSEDDLRVLMEAQSISAARLKVDPDLVGQMVNFVRDWHDRRRFPWIGESWEPTEQDRSAAVLATTALLAMRRLETIRRSEGKTIQEELVARQLRRAQFDQVATKTIKTLSEAPTVVIRAEPG